MTLPLNDTEAQQWYRYDPNGMEGWYVHDSNGMEGWYEPLSNRATWSSEGLPQRQERTLKSSGDEGHSVSDP